MTHDAVTLRGSPNPGESPRTPRGGLARAAGAVILAMLLSGCRTDVTSVDLALDNGGGCLAAVIGQVNSVSIQVWSGPPDDLCVLTEVCVPIARENGDEVDSLPALEAQLAAAGQPLLDVPLASATRVAVLGFAREDCTINVADPLLCGSSEPDDASGNGSLAIDVECIGGDCGSQLLDSCR